ncbi:kinase-like domain-containing protein [Lasiosphaeria hispida]|uniref:non-specific serine/threonine protein kinase n=1 Tax=Lasiosphaeria hispida TaxID=260671 RepID=A0AAJ0H8K7_9PEZI|nr:kinase-like domain-containing protein [Lasiosphaeria hispida]
MMAEQYQVAPPVFTLVPLNTASRRAIENPINNYHQQTFENNIIGLWLSFDGTDKEEYTIGRNRECDIYLPEQKGFRGAISDLHAAFRIVPETGAVLLIDYSEHGLTSPFAPSSSNSSSHAGFTIKFRGDSRSVLVALGINSRIAFGRDNHYQFEIRWHSDGLYGFRKDEPYSLGPRQARHRRYVQKDEVGGGAYGSVVSALDITNGRLMAVKRFHNLSGKNLVFATREMANLFKINNDRSIQHEHILQILESAGGGDKDNWGEIFMPLKAGNLKLLVETTPDLVEAEVANVVLRQMLLALQCIASHKIVHRDIKPENILLDYNDDGSYHFCLGDFGLSNDPKLARTVAGTEPFMAPEVFHRQPQSTKVDIWSLFATYIWVYNTQGFRRLCTRFGAGKIHDWLNQIARLPEHSRVRNMANFNPKTRPSASDQLKTLDADEDDEGGYGDDGGSDGLPYHPGAGDDEVGDELASDFQNAMRLNGDSGIGYGPDSGEVAETPEVPWFEPYMENVNMNYHWENNEQGPSDVGARYMMSPMGGHSDQDDPRGDPQAFVLPYGDTYGPAEETGSGTVVPDQWTQRPLMTEEEPVYQDTQRRRHHKGKQKG